MNHFKLLPLLLLPFVAACSSSPRFQAGQCIAAEFDQPVEYWEHRPRYQFSYKVIEVGQAHYLLQYWYGSGHDELAQSEDQSTFPFYLEDDYNVPIDCKSLDPL